MTVVRRVFKCTCMRVCFCVAGGWRRWVGVPCASERHALQLRLLCADGAEVQRWRTALAGVVDERLSVAVGDGADGAGSWCLAAPVSWPGLPGEGAVKSELL